MSRLHRVLAGDDRPGGGGALPAAELLAPLPLVALIVLGLNDWVLKGAGWLPGWLTGKLSDFAGVFVFPLVVTAACDVLAMLVARRADFTLRRWKLALAIGATAALFAATKLVPAAGAAVASVLALITRRHAAVVTDPTDLVALVVLAGTWLCGRRAIARGSYGRLAWARRAGKVPPLYADAIACGADPARVAVLEGAIAAGDDAKVAAALSDLRRP